MKSFFLAGISLLTSIYVLANEPRSANNSKGNIELGGRIGINISSGKGEQYLSFNSSSGISFAAAVNIPLSAEFAFQPELSYVQKGFSYWENIYEATKTFNYVELPLLIQYHLGSERLKLMFNFGPSIGYLLSGTIRRGSYGGTAIDMKSDRVNQFELGFVGGVGLGIQAGPGRVILEGRIEYGLTDVQTITLTDNSGTSMGQEEISNIGYMINVGYMIPL